MNNFLIITNPAKKEAVKNSKIIEKMIIDAGCLCTGNIMTEKMGEDRTTYTNPLSVPKETEAVIVLGGDGTFIHAAKDLLKLRLPLIGVNYGTLGYLSETEVENFRDAVSRLKNDDFIIEERMLLRGEIIRNEEVIIKDIALNDVVFNRMPPTGIMNYEIKIDGVKLNKYAADGMIISTPTGSTGYNLSAGGPVVQPTAEIILITPVSAHTLNSRAIVFSARVEVEVRGSGYHEDDNRRIFVSFDGDSNHYLESGDTVKVRKSRQFAKIIKISDSSFVETLGRKMR